MDSKTHESTRMRRGMRNVPTTGTKRSRAGLLLSMERHWQLLAGFLLGLIMLAVLAKHNSQVASSLDLFMIGLNTSNRLSIENSPTIHHTGGPKKGKTHDPDPGPDPTQNWDKDEMYGGHKGVDADELHAEPASTKPGVARQGQHSSNDHAGVIPPVFPVKEKIRVLSDYDSLRGYVAAAVMTAENLASDDSKLRLNGMQVAANGDSGALNETKVIRRVLRDGRQMTMVMKKAVKVEIRNLSLTPTEEVLLKQQTLYWFDVSAHIHENTYAYCVSCAYDYLMYDTHGRQEHCTDLRPDKVWCDRWCPLKAHCHEWYGYQVKSLNELEGHLSIKTGTEKNWPYVVIFRQSFVTRHGHVYNDEVAFDPRWHCPRASFPVIRPEQAWHKFSYKKVFVLDNVWRGPYHDIIDVLAPMTAIYEELLADPSIMIHTTVDAMEDSFEEFPNIRHRASRGLEEMMEVLGIHRSRVVTGDVYGDEVIAVQMHCHNSDSLFQIYGQRLSKMIHNLGHQSKTRHVTAGGNSSTSIVRTGVQLGEGTILVIKRSFNRVVENHNKLMKALRKAINKKVTVYDDTHNLTKGEIWDLFYRADVIIAPHGAALSNLLAAREGTVVYEILQPVFPNPDPANMNLCYKDICATLHLRYFGDLPVTVHRPPDYFNLTLTDWVKRSSSMVINVTRTVRNIKSIVDILVDKPQGPGFSECPNCYLFAKSVTPFLYRNNSH